MTKRMTKRTKQPAVTFADFCATDAPTELGLDPDNVGRIRRMMSGPEMQAVSTLTALERNLKLRRKSFLLGGALAWERLVLTARCMWLAWKRSAL
jgi:hypothetical protein